MCGAAHSVGNRDFEVACETIDVYKRAAAECKDLSRLRIANEQTATFVADDSN
jgi:hypothetical protein